jgi:[citrate (pro-3S)-lyase] ligase
MFFSDELNQNNPIEVEEIKKFLKIFDVDYDFPDITYVIRDNGEIIATGSASGNILKYFFAKCTYSGQGAIGVIYNSLLEYIMEKGYNSYFIFTTPNNKAIFESLGLNEVYATNSVMLLEGGFYNYDKWIDKVKGEIGSKVGKRGAIIANCNPMTLGHKYLMTKALEEVDELIIFIVEEDLSIFPFEARYNIVANEFKDNDRVKVVKGGPYIISRGTFPTYFIKQKDKMLDIYTELDAKIFADKIAKDLEIDIRFLGSEPKDVVTLAYNNSLKRILEEREIEVKIISRIEKNEKPISASFVRQLIKEDNIQEAYEILPISTIEFLNSHEGKAIISKIKESS